MNAAEGTDLDTLAVVAPEEATWPDGDGLWIVDLDGLEPEEATARAVAARQASGSARVVCLDRAEEPGGRDDLDLPALLEREVRDRLAFEISLPPLSRYVLAVRRFIADRAKETWGERPGFGMELVLDELCLNAIEHGPPFPARFRLAVWVEESVLHYCVSNQQCPASEPGSAMHSSLREFDASGNNLEEKGRGLFLVARIVDGLKVEGRDGSIQVHVWRDMRATHL